MIPDENLDAYLAFVQSETLEQPDTCVLLKEAWQSCPESAEPYSGAEKPD